ncbi:LLM class flavin-dependent oxidoreductase [Nonomuraea sp. NPDC059023]|uniref:LLM class flavin-dependent oxidoreductase n=1 Tax=unclassified Nonomuraea TaxID=2593643 RepID=UPI003680493E
MEFGFSLVPTPDIAAHRELVTVAEETGLDLVGVQDHPYAPSQVDAFALIGTLLEHTERIRFFPDVASLPLRPPAVLANTAATLDLASGGRFELGIGAGGYWRAIASMGVPELKPAVALDALGEAMEIMRALWSPDQPTVRLRGEHHTVNGVHAGPPPAHPINIWVGAQGPRALRFTGRLADGWAAPIPSYLPYESWPEANSLIDQAARAEGRDPAAVMRMAQIVGTITSVPGELPGHGSDPVRGTPDQWAEFLAKLAIDQPFTTFIFWPEQQSAEQVVRFATEVVPLVKERTPNGVVYAHER